MYHGHWSLAKIKSFRSYLGQVGCVLRSLEVHFSLELGLELGCSGGPLSLGARGPAMVVCITICMHLDWQRVERERDALTGRLALGVSHGVHCTSRCSCLVGWPCSS